MRSTEKPRVLDDTPDKTKTWELTEVTDTVKCRVVTMPENKDHPVKVLHSSVFRHSFSTSIY